MKVLPHSDYVKARVVCVHSVGGIAATPCDRAMMPANSPTHRGSDGANQAPQRVDVEKCLLAVAVPRARPTNRRENLATV